MKTHLKDPRQPRLSCQRVQIERTIVRGDSGAKATFRRTDGHFLCEASIWHHYGGMEIWPRGGPLDVDEAGQVAIAIRMALEWIWEEGLAK